MADEPTHVYDTPHAAKMVCSRRFNLIWIVPLVALVATAGVLWRSYAERGPLITIYFDSAAGLEAGRTQIKHKNVLLGTVETVKPTTDLSQVVVTARMGKAAEPFLNDGAFFWVVKPSLSARDVSGLGTFISGAYIEFVPGHGNERREFKGEQNPAYIPSEDPGKIFTLHTSQLGSIGQGAAVYFHGFKVGRVLGDALSDKDGSVSVRIVVNTPHEGLVHEGTRFWNTSGVSVAVGNNGLKIQLNSIESLLTGGIAFDVPPGTEAGPAAVSDAPFTLYADETSADDSIYTKHIHFLLHFAQAVPGLSVGSPVRLQGIIVGRVSQMEMDYDSLHNHLIVPVTIEIDTERMKLVQGSAHGDMVFRKLVMSGLRARLGSGNLLTGQKVIDLDLIKDAPPAKMIEGGIYPEIPVTDANDVDSIMRSTKELVTKLQTAAGTLDKTLKQTGTAISSDDGGGDLAGTLSEVKDAARSVRVLSDYLEEHPEAVLKGKSEDDTK